MQDLIIRGATVVDGTGAPAFPGDVAVKDGRITAVGRVEDRGRTEIPAEGRVAAPGFIDVHRHGDAALFRPDHGELELREGLTTVVNGNCGLSIAPVAADWEAAVRQYLLPVTGAYGDGIPTWSMAAYLDAAEAHGTPIHAGMLAGTGSIRASVAGYGQEHMTAAETDRVRGMLAEALAEGALGVSLGLGYAPECFYTTEELIGVLAPLRGTDIPLTVHMREEGDQVCQALEEMLTVARAVGMPLHISHLKAMGKRNWREKIPRALERIARAREEGLDVTCDVYPYTAGSTQLIHVLPHDFLVGGNAGITARLRDPAARAELTERLRTGTDFDNIVGMVGWENILLSTLNRPENKPYEGKSVAEIAAMRGQDPYECAYDLLISEDCAITMIDFIAHEEDILEILRAPFSSLISDSTYPTQGKPHPRVYGSCVRLLERYVRGGQLSLETAVNRMTGNPAQALRLRRKGVLAPGMDADLCLFDLAKLHEAGTYADPAQFARGMDWVIVGGEAAIAEGRRTGSRGGAVLRRQRDC